MRRGLVFVAALSLMFAGVFGMRPAHAQASLASLHAQLVKTRDAIVSSRSRLKAIDVAVVAANKKLNDLAGVYTQKQHRMAVLRQNIASLEAQIRTERNKLAQEQTAYNAIQKKADGMMVWDQKNGTVTFLQVLFGVKTWQTFVSRLSEISQVLTSERATLQALAAQGTQLKKDIAALQAHQKTLGSDLSQVVAAKRDVAQSLAQQKSALASYQAEHRKLVAAEQDLYKQENNLSSEIQQLAADLKAGKLTYAQLYSMVKVIASAYSIDPKLVMAVIHQESGGNTHATSSVGAQGLMQLMPGTAKDLGVKNPYDPKQNVRGGIAFLSYLLDKFHNNIPLALAAYNAGPGAVEKYGGIPPYPETINYVKNIMYLYNHGY